ncbi:hypothetical protein [Rubinisphaera sp.]|uniref:hypothetical protein n=1 Tax=Rubinisphaera sp. TaxID=2024857 RepID=UPI000C0CC088|nr:hypothetical protein [Rubinisphaera sp.]MBV07684.1 hypothetical protein [Rubinisphaera sp.]HCS53290.1 hypothetical protein [Planctomycetaceae bacterium]|tara:strand:- start:9391 stop:9669 length:279 start_codon:yes stop_codon:yes gene_type:complete
MMNELTEEQFRTWWAFHLFVEPFEPERMDRRFGMLACFVEALLCGNDSQLQPGAFDLGWNPDREYVADNGQDWQLMKAKTELIMSSYAHMQG